LTLIVARNIFYFAKPVHLSMLLLILGLLMLTNTNMKLKLTSVFLFIFLSHAAFSQISMKVEPNGFFFMDGPDSVFFFRKTPGYLNGKYARCNDIHPLYGLDNVRLTEDFPADYLHQRGVFWAWHQIFIDGKQVSDGWELKNFEQKITDFEYRLRQGLGQINTHVDWLSPLWKGGKEAYLKEETQILVHPATKNFRRIDFEIRLKALTDRLTIGGSADEKGCGGFSVRLKLPEDVVFSGEGGPVEPQNTAVDAGRFVTISGSFLKGRQPGGMVIYSNPGNPAPSTKWILCKAASMQNAAFPGPTPVAIPFDQPLTLKYSLLIYRGEMNNRQIERALKF
jgi:hypothetical protein